MFFGPVGLAGPRLPHGHPERSESGWFAGGSELPGATGVGEGGGVDVGKGGCNGDGPLNRCTPTTHEGSMRRHRSRIVKAAFLKESTMAHAESSLPSPNKAHMLTSPWDSFGQSFDNLTVWGRPARFPVVNERAVRATAGIVMVLAAVAIAIAYFDKNYTPIRIIAVLVAADYAVRQVAGLTPLSPIGTLGTFLVRNQTPEWVGATQKRFAWALAFGMALLIAILTNVGVHGLGVQLIGLMLIGLLWLESVVGFCVGCFIYSRLIKADLIHPEDAPACGGNSCEIAAPAAAG